MKSLAFKLLLATWLGCMTSAVAALPDDIPAKREPYPEFALSGYDMSSCNPLPKQKKKNGKPTKIYWVNDMEEPVVILWLWADGSTRFVKRVMPKKGYYTAFYENQTMALIAEERQQCIFTGTIEADDDGKRLDMSDLFVYSIKKKRSRPAERSPAQLSVQLADLGYQAQSCISSPPSSYVVGDERIPLTIVNDLPVDLQPAYLDLKGEVKLLRKREANSRWKDSTYSNTVWVWLDDANKKCIGVTRISDGLNQKREIYLSNLSAEGSTSATEARVSIVSPAQETATASESNRTSGLSTNRQPPTTAERLALLVHEMNSAKRVYNDQYELRQVRMDYEKQELIYLFSVKRSISELDVGALEAGARTTYCTAKNLELFREEEIPALWIYEDSFGDMLEIPTWTSHCG